MKFEFDESGKWQVFENGSKALVEPSQKWLDKREAEKPEQQKQEIKLKLQELDTGFLRSVEELIDALLVKNILTNNDIPFLAIKKENRKALRKQLEDL
jgi:3-oxoacyl-[acyl-carrier-protein] synthase III